eukprot:4184166-Amphidinium_carterae.2
MRCLDGPESLWKQLINVNACLCGYANARISLPASVPRSSLQKFGMPYAIIGLLCTVIRWEGPENQAARNYVLSLTPSQDDLLNLDIHCS